MYFWICLALVSIVAGACIYSYAIGHSAGYKLKEREFKEVQNSSVKVVPPAQTLTTDRLREIRGFHGIAISRVEGGLVCKEVLEYRALFNAEYWSKHSVG